MKEFRTKHQKKVDRIFNHKTKKVRDGVKRTYFYISPALISNATAPDTVLRKVEIT